MLMCYMQPYLVCCCLVILVTVSYGRNEDSLEEDDIRTRRKSKTNQLQSMMSMMNTASQLGLLNAPRDPPKKKTSMLGSILGAGNAAAGLGLIQAHTEKDSNRDPPKKKTSMLGSILGAGNAAAGLGLIQAHTEKDRAKDGDWRTMLASQVTPERALQAANFMMQLRNNSQQ